ncbi:ligand-binding sensor domain-containing protein, partial [Algibacter sp.]|uniref:ligand-binding sensor domain-containing protein n=1 Tax=Algibacter sp. TaxID=1872428 RepID=UPI003C77747C
NNINNEENQFIKLDHFSVSENRILSIINLSDGTLMCSTENDGLFHLNADGQIINHYLANKTDVKGIVANSIWHLFLDRNERIWISYYNSGIGIYDKLYDKFKDIESLQNNSNSLQIGSVTAITNDQSGNFWVSLDGGGIDVFNHELNQFTHINSSENKVFSGLTNDYIESLFIDSNQNIWAGSWSKGLFLLKKGSKKFINYTIENTDGSLSSNNILSIAEDSEGTIWFASWDKGIHSYNPNTNTFIHHKSEPFLKHGIQDSYARKVLFDKNGNLWVTTISKGLFKIKKLEDGTFSVVSMEARMSEEFNNQATVNHVMSLYEGIDGLIWIGTRGAGLFKYNPDADKFTWYNKLNGLEAINITGIIEDLNGDIWLSTHSGITKFDMATNSFTRFTKDDGLLSNDFNANANFKDKEGTIYFGNYLGIDYFDPLNISVNTIVPSLYLTRFKLFNEDVFPNEKDALLSSVIGETEYISLDHTQSVFTIEYTGVNYTRPELNQYAYYLEGFEESWNYVGSLKSATYTNLEHGNYTFKLKAANSDGKWTETPLSLNITVLPPWWKTNEALFIYIALLLLGFYLLNRMAQIRLNKKQAITLERNLRLQEKALNEEKFQFFTNISHEFRTPLTLIMNPINDIIRDESLNLP